MSATIIHDLQYAALYTVQFAAICGAGYGLLYWVCGRLFGGGKR